MIGNYIYYDRGILFVISVAEITILFLAGNKRHAERLWHFAASQAVSLFLHAILKCWDTGPLVVRCGTRKLQMELDYTCKEIRRNLEQRSDWI